MSRIPFSLTAAILALFWLPLGATSSLADDAQRVYSDIRQEFQTAAREDLALLESIAPELPEGLSPAQFREAQERTEIEIFPSLILRGAEVDAINYPSLNVIKISASRWQAMSGHPERKKYLAMHELFGIMKVELDNFFVSIKIKRDLEKEAQASADFHATIERALANIVEIMNEALGVDFTRWNADIDRAHSSDEYRSCVSHRPFFSSYWHGVARDIACKVVEQDLENLKGRVSILAPTRKINGTLFDCALTPSRFSRSGEMNADCSRLLHLVAASTAISTELEKYAEEDSACKEGKEGIECEFKRLRERLGDAPAFWMEKRKAFRTVLLSQGLSSSRAESPE